MLARSKSLQNYRYGGLRYGRCDDEWEDVSPVSWRYRAEEREEEEKSPAHPRFISIGHVHGSTSRAGLARQHLENRDILSLQQRSAYILAMALNNSKRSYESFSEHLGSSSIFSEPSQAFKRPRANIEPSLWNQILSLPHTTIQSLLYQICSANPSLSSFVTSAHDARVAEEAARPPVNFDNYSRDCWYTMNKKYKRLSCGKQFEMMGDICQVLDESRDAIVDAAGADVRWETRRNALEALRKICKSIMLCDEPQIRHELMKDGYMLGQFADSMQELARGMTKEERKWYKQEGLYEKLLELHQECDPIEMEGLPIVYKIFDGVEDDEGDEEDEEEGGEQEEDEYEDQDCEADVIDDTYEHNDDQTGDEELILEEKGEPRSTVDSTLEKPDHGSSALKLLQHLTEPSHTHRTKVFSIGELS
ncbi:hypothetical protein ONS95_013672 [Cadophora gregata]|uniref:uncharacterized protein n=1 Tax=Cadophora gregata TaxID=51156 RepID=UPI0026DB7048|nr:uncharacterized protein ONS95_013672 [Cadophora gregata]KAK0113415.1 hypothetical protein ONS96_014281 [Cadophora gregata f. sp. sojae]KAK0114172.1 hypothetical protein ONS95_013672 [Cadophora gregata]